MERILEFIEDDAVKTEHNAGKRRNRANKGNIDQRKRKSGCDFTTFVFIGPAVRYPLPLPLTSNIA